MKRLQTSPRLVKIERMILFPLLFIAMGAYSSLGRVQVSGESMSPTYKSGQKLTFLKNWKQISPLKVGDIVIIKPSADNDQRESEMIKRIAFIQNEQATLPTPKYVMTGHGRLHTQFVFGLGTKLNEPGGIYVLGDNYDNSMDSRDFGAVHESDILGKVITTP